MIPEYTAPGNGCEYSNHQNGQFITGKGKGQRQGQRHTNCKGTPRGACGEGHDLDILAASSQSLPLQFGDILLTMENFSLAGPVQRLQKAHKGILPMVRYR